MRKILLATLLFIGAISNCFAQLTESFEGTFPPAGWTIESTNTENTWEGTLFGINGSGALVLYDLTQDQDESLISPVFTVPTGSPILQFDFYMGYEYGVAPNNNYDFIVSISTNGGTTWAPIWDESELGVFDDYEEINVVIPLTAYAGQTNVKLKFQYVGVDGDVLVLDEIKVLTPAGYCLDAPLGLYPEDPFTPECVGVPEQIVANSWAGEYALVNVTAGTEYIFSSSVATDFITISTDGGTTAAAYGVTPLTWTPTASGEIRYYLHTNDICGTQQTARGRYIKCGVQTVFPPSCSTLVFPANGATNITAVDPIVLSWNAPTTGDAPTSYDLYIGFAPGVLNFFENYTDTETDPIPVGEYDLTVYWKVIPRNIAGEAVGCTTEFSFTTEAAPAAPENDDCAGAIALVAGSEFDQNAVVGTIMSATTTAGIEPTCQDDFSADVWYTVTIPASGTLTVETQQTELGELSDTVMVAFSGACGSLTEIPLGCSDDDGDGFMSLLNLTGTAGQVYYIGVWQYGTDAPEALGSRFRISAYDASLSSGNFDLSTFKAYPNPVKDVLNLEYASEITSVKVVNMLGQEVISRTVKANTAALDMSSFTPGIYIVNVTFGDSVKSLKVIKQ